MNSKDKLQNISVEIVPLLNDQEVVVDETLDGDTEAVMLYNKISSSISILADSIAVARMKFRSSASAPKSVFERLNSYEEVLNKQKSLAEDLMSNIIGGKKEEVLRCMMLINELSSFINQDAKSIVSALSQLEEEGEGRMYYC